MLLHPLEHPDQPDLVLGGDPGDHPDIGQLPEQLVVAHRRELGAGDRAPLDPELAADRRGGRGVVARDHPHADPRALAPRDRIPRLRPGRVDDPDHREEREVLDEAQQVAVAIERGGVEVTLRDDHHALAALRHAVVRLEGQVPVVVGDRHERPVGAPERPTARDQHVGRALHVAADDLPPARFGHLVERRHELVLGVERDLGEPRVRGAGLVHVQPALGAEHDQGAFGGVADQPVALEDGVGAQDHREQVGVEVDP